MAKVAESGRARTNRLLRETLCECKDPAIVSKPDHKGKGKYIHLCVTCGGYA